MGLVDRQAKLVLLWTAKAGCTTGLVMMLQNMNLLETALKYHPWPHKYRQHVFYKEQGCYNPVPKRYYVLKLIRNPYDRAVSSYLHCMKHTTLDYSFVQFLRTLQKYNMDFKIRGKSSRMVNFHSARQYIPGEKRYVDRYLHLEKFEEEVQQLNRDRKLKLQTRANCDTLAKHHVDKSASETISYLGGTSYRKLPKTLPPSYQYFYNTTTRKLVEKLYHNDIVQYGYQFYKSPESIPDLNE